MRARRLTSRFTSLIDPQLGGIVSRTSCRVSTSGERRQAACPRILQSFDRARLRFRLGHHIRWAPVSAVLRQPLGWWWHLSLFGVRDVDLVRMPPPFGCVSFGEWLLFGSALLLLRA